MGKVRQQGNCYPFTISGTGAQRKVFYFFSPAKDGSVAPQTKHNGKICRIVARQEAGGGATAVTMDFVHRSHTGTDPAVIPDEYIPVHVDSQAPTADAKTAFFDSIVEARPAFQESLKLILDVTSGSGAWTITGYVELE